jgi:SOS response regulatory protein OraA/RecX
MIRKSRFGLKASRGASRDLEQDAKENPDGSNSSSDDAESTGAKEGIDCYERSSDRYRAASNERADAEGSASARRSSGNSFSKGGSAVGDKPSGGFKGSSFSSSKGGGSSFGRKSTFGKSASASESGSSLSSGTSKAEAIAASAVGGNENASSEEAEPVFERSSDRAFPKKRSSFGGGGLGRSSVKASAGESDDVYERSSDKQFGRGASSGRKSSFGGKAATKPAHGEDVFERSTERATSRRSAFSKKPTDDKSANVVAGLAEQQDEANIADLNSQLKQSRTLLEHAVVQMQATSTKTPVTASHLAAIAGNFEPADPFEPFEQCIPSAGGAVNEQAPTADDESVYTRRTTGRGKQPANSESKSKRPQLSLRGRALGYLSRREHSRAELARKLTPHVTVTDSLETLLDALEREGWLSNERFVESVVHRRGAKLGTSRIVHELKRNGIDETLIQDANAALKDTELTRARDVWSKKYGELPITPADRAKQGRFLATRGFTSGVIMKVLEASDDDFGIE